LNNLEIPGYFGNLTSINDIFTLDQYITVECLRNGLKITLELNDLQRQTKTYEPMKLVLISSNDRKTCEMEIHGGIQPISMLVPELCLSNDTMQKILLMTGNKTIHEFQLSCDQDIISVADLNGESVKINSSVQIGFDFSLVILSKHIPFRIIDCWTEQNNHRTKFLKNGIPVRDSRSVPLCQLFDGIDNVGYNFNSNIGHLDEYNNVHPASINQMRKIWQIRLRLGWDAIPDSRQKAFQQLLRTKPQLQWEAVPDLLFDSKDFSSPVTIYPIMIQCSILPLSFERTSVIVSFGPIGVFIPQFYFLENAFFSCCPVKTTIAYANLLDRPDERKLLCSKVSTTTALLVSFTAFAVAACCTAITFIIRHKK
uniref:Recep_L_domain domain-containing protein n=1 Tax=Onchocerca flexuosa TaxID=387005 RepID=A0A183GYD2_9BILA